MKLIIKFVSITYILIIIMTSMFLYSKGDSNIEVNKEIIKDYSVDYIYEHNNTIISEVNDVITINDSLTYEGNIIKSISCDSCYVLIENDNQYYLLVINENNINTYDLNDFTKINDFQIHDNYIYIVGTLEDNLQVVKYDLLVNIICCSDFTGEGYQEGTHILIDNNYIYVGGIKSAHTFNQHFYNVGNIGEIKSFVCKLNLDLELIDICYFNEGTENEQIKSLIKYNKGINIILNTNPYCVYELNQDFDIIKKEEIKLKIIDEIETLKQNDPTHLYITNSFNKINLNYYHDDEELVLYTTYGDYLSYQYINGVFTIYYIYDDKTYKEEISEYHINYINDLVLDYYNVDENTMSHFNVDSYFEDLNFELENISPYFNRNMCGSYISTYKTTKKDGSDIVFDTKTIIKPYMNVVDNGVYTLGSRLYYFGTGTLNGSNITSGYALNKEGKHSLEITNVNGEKKSYTIYVVDNYYHDNMDINMETTYTIEYGDKLYLEINSSKMIKEIYINQNQLGKICQINSKQYLEISNNFTSGIKTYKINKIVFDDDTYIDVDYYFTVKTKKKEVSYNITEYEDDGKLVLHIDIEDIDQNILDTYITVYNQTENIYHKSTYVKNVIDNINIKNQQEITLSLNLRMKESSDVTLFSYIGNGDELSYEINFIIEDSKIIRIIFTLDLSNKNLTHNKMYVGATEIKSLVNKYQTENSNIMWIIAIILSGTILIGFCIYIFIKHMSKKRKGL